MRRRLDRSTAAGFMVTVFLGEVVVGQLAINDGIKFLVPRERPAVLHLVSTSGTSFPSGHSAVATSRALLGGHGLTDVIAGVAVGWGRRMRFGRPAEAVAGKRLPATPVEAAT